MRLDAPKDPPDTPDDFCQLCHETLTPLPEASGFLADGSLRRLSYCQCCGLLYEITLPASRVTELFPRRPKER